MSEGTIVPGVDTGASNELETLVRKLIGHGAFERCRDSLQYSVIDTIERAIRDSTGRTDAQARLYAVLADVYVMGSMLAGLKFNNQQRAYKELRKALMSRNFFLTGETVPLGQTVPVTILMLEPAKTFILLQWMAEARTAELYAHLGIPFRRMEEAPVQEVTRRLFAEFPMLENRVRQGHEAKQDCGTELEIAFKETIAGLPDSFPGSLPLITSEMERLLDTNATGGCGSMFTFPVAWMFPGKEQSEILGLFDRKDQERVTTWQLHVPLMTFQFNGTFEYVKIGMHPESEHAQWARRMPPFVSKGVTRSHGALFHATSTDYDTLEEYCNKMTNETPDGPSGRTWNTVAIPGTRPRILMRVRADRNQITEVNSLLKQWEERAAT